MRIWLHVSGAIVAFGLLYLTTLLLQDHPVAAYSRVYNPLDITPGSVVRVHADIERTATCDSEVIVQWIDQSGNPLEEERYHQGILKEGKEAFDRDRRVPPNAPEGVLRLRVKTLFYCNWLQRFMHMGSVFIMPDVIFQVSKKDSE